MVGRDPGATGPARCGSNGADLNSCERIMMAGRVAIVTGVSRRAGIGFAIARTLLQSGMSVFIQSWSAHDADQPWGSDAQGMAGVLETLRQYGDRLEHVEADFALPTAPAEAVNRAVQLFGHVDVVVANHATSSGQRSLADVTAEDLDYSWAVNARASVLLTQAFAAQHDDRRNGGRVILFTSGQHLAPMAHQLPYAISKGAIHQMTLTLSEALVDRGITVNTVNPGPTDTGWATPRLFDQVRSALPAGRWGSVDDIARLVAWLASDESAWITGQVLNSEGGFRRWKV
jgi:3-oxoacyl-[acyl-carrier protein] reductase